MKLLVLLPHRPCRKGSSKIRPWLPTCSSLQRTSRSGARCETLPAVWLCLEACVSLQPFSDLVQALLCIRHTVCTLPWDLRPTHLIV